MPVLNARLGLSAALLLTLACGDDPAPSLSKRIDEITARSCSRDFKCEPSESRSMYASVEMCSRARNSNVTNYVERQDDACGKALVAALQCESKAPCGDVTGRCAAPYTRVAELCPDLGDASTDTDDDSSETPRMPSGGGASNACQTCIADECPGGVRSCLDSTACREYLDCTADCDDSACESECVDDHPEGEIFYRPLGGCIAQECRASCAS